MSPSSGREADIKRLYAAFNAREIEDVLARLTGDVRWANGMEGGHVVGRDAVREYWLRQFETIQSRVEPLGISEAAEGRLAVRVRHVVRDPDEQLLADQEVRHRFGFRDGLIERFDIGADRRQIACDCYEAFAAGDRAFFEERLSRDFRFSAPPDPQLDRDGYFERCWPGAGRHQEFDLVRVVELGDEIVVTYETDLSSGGRGRNTEVLTFNDDDGICRVEVYFGWNLS